MKKHTHSIESITKHWHWLECAGAYGRNKNRLIDIGFYLPDLPPGRKHYWPLRLTSFGE